MDISLKMLEVQLLETQIDQVIKRLATRSFTFDKDYFLKIEKKRRELLIQTQELKTQRNQLSQQIGMKRKNQENSTDLIRQVNQVNQSLLQLEEQLKKTQQELDHWLMGIPNLPHESVPIGKDEHDNVEIKKHDRPRQFSFSPKNHVELGEMLGLNISAGVNLSGSRFSVLQGNIARLHRALGQFMLDLHINYHGYTEYQTPYIVNDEILEGTGQLPKFAQDMYCVLSGDGEQKSQYLISTGEITLTNLFRDKITTVKQLPARLTTLSPCFRSEAGSYGKDTKGLIRQHQFDKVEMVQITTPQYSYQALEELVNHAEKVLQALELPYRVIMLCTGDMGFSAAKTYDIEVWVPSENTYREISSCSNCEDFQARRMRARFRDIDGKNKLVHTLNGSGVAVGRALVALLENHQNEDGSINIPVPLRAYLGGITRLKAEKNDNTK